MLLTNRLANNLDPWRVMNALEEQWNQQFGDWFQAPSFSQSSQAVRLWTNEGEAVVQIDLPGATPEQIDLSVHQDLLTVNVQTPEEHAEEAEQFHLRERLPQGRREIRLPFVVDPQRTEAEYRHGVLRVTVYQPDSHRPAKVSVKGA